MIVVPDIVQRMVAHHGVDVVALDRELRLHQHVRTRTWMAGGGGTPRHVLETLPTAFPPFKAHVFEGRLRVERMRIGQDAFLEGGATFVRLAMPWPQLPDTILAALPGRPLADLVGHPGIGADTRILKVGARDNGGVTLIVLGLDMPHAALAPVDTTPSRKMVTHDLALDALISETHEAMGMPALDGTVVVDSRTWHALLEMPGASIAGLRIEHPAMQDDPHIALRFPYDKAVALGVGRAGVGAWFDRKAYAWQIEPTPRAIEWLRTFLATRDVIVGPDGRIHRRRRT